MANPPSKKPGSGRYTTYVPVDSPRNKMLRELFNKKAGDAGALYGDPDQTNNIDAAAVVLARAKDDSKGIIPASGHQSGDPDMFTQGVKLDYTGEVDGVSAPDLSEVKWKKPGDPIGGYVPDISSPGPGKTDGVQKDNPEITQEEVYADVTGKSYLPGANTASPKASSEKIGNTASLGSDLEKGKSSSSTGQTS